ncbi:Dam family site-specific DNA-(adenine-N6)-methyltransferase [Thioalkalivibrio sp. ALE31]|uniref:DNA adenine methylase n=1 Tax=Thioalkalivibrio sp. ALE31 TaxID=1158182 RepID=UPI0009DB18FA
MPGLPHCSRAPIFRTLGTCKRRRQLTCTCDKTSKQDDQDLERIETPLQPFLRWAGGKRWFVPKWQKLTTRASYQRYVEPFLGGGSIFFATRPRISLIADSNERLIETYIVLRDHPSELLELLKRHEASHGSDYFYKVRNSSYLHPLERAAQFIYLNRTCWNGLYRVNKKGKFNVPIGTDCKRVIHPYDDFHALAKILYGADIQCQDFEKTIDATGPGDLLFVDPPYTVKHNFNGFVKYNEEIFCWEDQERLCEALKRAKQREARITLMNANHDSIRELYRGSFLMTPVTRASRIAGDPKARGKYNELLIQG